MTVINMMLSIMKNWECDLFLFYFYFSSNIMQIPVSCRPPSPHAHFHFVDKTMWVYGQKNKYVQLNVWSQAGEIVKK